MSAVKAPRRAIAIGQTAMSTSRNVETIAIGDGFSATVNGLTVVGEPQIDAWADVGKRLRILERGAQFALGDFVNGLESRFAEEASQIVDATDWSLKTVSIYRWLSASIDLADRRMDRLSIAHHLLVAALSKAKQREWLRKAADDENEVPWTVARLRAAMRAGEDLKPTGWWVLVACENEKDQRKLVDQMEKAGRAAKAVVRRERVPKKKPKKK